MKPRSPRDADRFCEIQLGKMLAKLARELGVEVVRSVEADRREEELRDFALLVRAEEPF